MKCHFTLYLNNTYSSNAVIDSEISYVKSLGHKVSEIYIMISAIFSGRVQLENVLRKKKV